MEKIKDAEEKTLIDKLLVKEVKATKEPNEVIARDRLIKRISERKKILKRAKVELKAHFVGIDKEIDRICKLVETWYFLPEIMTRPVIICLFGPTGVGKTDLVRRLVKILEMQDKYCEVELASKGDGWTYSIGKAIKQSDKIESGKPGIILLDEIQGFRTIDEHGADIRDCEMKDLWTLLSDGKLPYKAQIESLLSMLWDVKRKDLEEKHNKLIPLVTAPETAATRKERREKKMEVEAEAQEERWDYYSLNYFKNVLRLDVPLEEIALWDDKKKRKIITERLMDKTIYDEEDYTKTLIFISGNIDEAYPFAKNAKEVDIDADIIHEMSKKISILDIKQALGKRFRPEQISRMGNMHVIYPSLGKKSFETIIERKVVSIIERVKAQTGITLVIDKSINTLIYDNGVFPTQGTRPLFSTISEILETSIPNFILNALLSNEKMIEISYLDNKIIALIGDVKYKFEYTGALDTLKNEHNKNTNRKALCSTHEAAHALVYSFLFGMVPSQIVSTPVSEDIGGFVYPQGDCSSKEMINNRICSILAGGEAEKLVFGELNLTSGSSSDISTATEMAVEMVREYGMYGFSSFHANPGKCHEANFNTTSTDPIIESIIKENSLRARDIITSHKPLLIETIDKLVAEDEILPEDFKNLCIKHGVNAEIPKSVEDKIYYGYSDKLEKFKSK